MRQSGKHGSKGPRIPGKLAAEELFEYAVKALGARAYSIGDLRAKLRLRAARAADIDAVVRRLEAVGYVDDTRFAESYAAARVANDGFGRARILMDLRAHRIPGEIAAQAVELALEGKEETAQIRAYIERRMPSLATDGLVEDPRKLAAAFRRLRRAGFSSGPVLTILRSIAAQPEFADEFPEEEPEI